MPNSNPVSAWKSLREGNARFIAGEEQNVLQSAQLRESLVEGQSPTAVIFGCGDSRVAAEKIFDQGLGDMFVVRTAGHVLDDAVIGSIEYAVAVLNVPLIVVLGHDRCGAVGATLDALDTGQIPRGFIRSIVERVTPSILIGRREGLSSVDEFVARHGKETARLLMERSQIISEAVGSGRCAIAAATYRLREGNIKLQSTIGEIGEIVE